MVAKKRKAGAGRKPKGSIRGKGETFTTRITAETRQAIEREAQRSGQSISQIAERLLMLGLESKRRRDQNRPLRAICFLIEQLALGAGSGRWMDPGRATDEKERKAIETLQNEWRTDPFRYRAFTIAVALLLDSLKPVGNIQSPHKPEELDEYLNASESPALLALIKNNYKSPENLGAYVFHNVWTQLNRAHPLTERERSVMGHGDWVGEIMREEFYALADARRDLELGSSEEAEK